jgi:hypothetical protein
MAVLIALIYTYFCAIHKQIMTTLTVTIDNKAQAKKLAGLLKSIKYVKEVRVEEPGIVLSDEDWVLPGRPATEAELEEMVNQMDKDTDSGITSQKFLEVLEKWNKKSA